MKHCNCRHTMTKHPSGRGTRPSSSSQQRAFLVRPEHLHFPTHKRESGALTLEQTPEAGPAHFVTHICDERITATIPTASATDVRHRMREGIYSGLDALSVAVMNGCLPAVLALLGRGADPNQLTHAPKMTLLQVAVRNDDARVARALLEHGADVRGTSPDGRDACFELASLEVAGVLVGAGADVNHASASGMTALFTAHGADTLQYLIRRGWRPEAVMHNGRNALHQRLPSALSEKSADEVRTLLRHGADMDQQDIFGNTPLHVAARAAELMPGEEPHFLRIMQTALQHCDEACLTARNRNGDTALSIAVRAASSIQRAVAELIAERAAQIVAKHAFTSSADIRAMAEWVPLDVPARLHEVSHDASGDTLWKRMLGRWS
jgi:hypothetical protein